MNYEEIFKQLNITERTLGEAGFLERELYSDGTYGAYKNKAAEDFYRLKNRLILQMLKDKEVKPDKIEYYGFDYNSYYHKLIITFGETEITILPDVVCKTRKGGMLLVRFVKNHIIRWFLGQHIDYSDDDDPDIWYDVEAEGTIEDDPDVRAFFCEIIARTEKEVNT